MHIDQEQLDAMSDRQLDDLHNFARCREKHHARHGRYALSMQWRAIASAVLLHQFRSEADAWHAVVERVPDRLF